MGPDGAVGAIASSMRERLLVHGFERHAALSGSLENVTPLAAAEGLPALRWLGPALAQARAEALDELADSIAVLESSVPWTRTAGYVAHPPHPGFLDGYAHVTLATSAEGGPFGGTALGLLLLGAEVHYPPHHHPADEVYLPLTPARWVHGLDEDHRSEPPGVPIHHRPWQPHGMRTDDHPLLAVYFWSGDVATPSQFC